ncbi:MAG: vitamin K epoxide reductase family protein [Candidatus Marinimicrobia bacterium]|nr:vitamin K epoxide reductase family protein [Candidatus Neomarinimicrobiota bacterium]
MNANLYYFGALLALVCGAFSFYFYSVYRGWISYRQWWVPRFCEMDSDQCTSIVDSNYGRIIGIPNALVGSIFLLFYSYALLSVPLELVEKSTPLYMGWFTIIIGVYLVYGLIRLKVSCPICLTVHVLNGTIFLLQLI